MAVFHLHPEYSASCRTGSGYRYGRHCGRGGDCLLASQRMALDSRGNSLLSDDLGRGLAVQSEVVRWHEHRPEDARRAPPASRTAAPQEQAPAVRWRRVDGGPRARSPRPSASRSTLARSRSASVNSAGCREQLANSSPASFATPPASSPRVSRRSVAVLLRHARSLLLSRGFIGKRAPSSAFFTCRLPCCQRAAKSSAHRLTCALNQHA